MKVRIFLLKNEINNSFCFISSEQQIILGAFGYLTPSKLHQLGKITFSFFGLSKNTPKMKINWVKHKTEGKSTKKPDLGI